jgi:predicted GTPase
VLQVCSQAGIQAVLDSAKALNPRAEVFITASEVSLDCPDLVAGKRVLCVEDGPTTTHGGMSSGAAAVAAAKYGAAEVVDPRPFFVGELKATLEKYPHIGKVVPAMGYSEQQVRGCSLQNTTVHLYLYTYSMSKND